MRAVDIHSRQLNTQYHVTTPQMICLVAIKQENSLTLSQLSKIVSLSPSTLTGILDRLEKKFLIERVRDKQDRRKVHIYITDEGRSVTESAPALLQDKLSQAVENLPELDQRSIADSLEKLIDIMDLKHIDASPHLVQGFSLTEFEKS